ncbi:MAG: PAS domain S-box protein [Myxococcota bacterium]
MSKAGAERSDDGAMESHASRRALEEENAQLREEVAELRRAIGDRQTEAERKLRPYQLLAAHARDIILLIDRRDGRILEANAAAVTAYGYERDELLGLTVFDLRAGETRELTSSQMTVADTHGLLFETVHQRKDGSTFPVEVSSVGARIERSTTLVSVIRDISARKKAERTLLRSESRLAAAVDLAELGLWEYDAAAGVIHADARCREVHGIEHDRPVTYDEMIALIHPDDRARVQERVRHALEDPDAQLYEVERRIVRSDGEQRWVAVRANIVRAEGEHGQRVVRLIGTLMDMTRRRNMEEDLRRAKNEADAASRAKSEFLARMSHEIRTPMNGVMGITELALMEENLPERAREYLTLAAQSAQGLLSIINDVLDLSAVEAGRVEIEAKPFEPLASVRAVTSTLEVVARAKGIGLRCRADPELPSVVIGDDGRLRQVLTNLVGNAVKFTSQGAIDIAVEFAEHQPVVRRPERLRIVFTVRDTGLGIAPSNLDCIFERFSEATRSTHAEFGGTGLGLSIAKQLVELMGGRIWVRSEPGAGSVFQFTIDVGVPETEAAAVTESVPASADVDLLQPLRVLVAEDNRLNQLVARRLLERLGHDVALASDGEEALEALARSRFDLVLMDVQMPKLDGDEVTRRVRAGDAGSRSRSVPIVALTAHAVDGDRERLLAAGMDDYLSKPLRAELLTEVLRGIAQRGRSARRVLPQQKCQ